MSTDAREPWPVVVVGAGPTGVTAATLLGQYGVRVLVLDRWDGVYPQPRAVHLDDEIYRILHRLGVAADFAAISRPARGMRLVDRHHRVLAEFDRDGEQGRHGHPRANMFDQPELEQLLRANLERQPTVTLRGNVEVSEVAQDGEGRVRVDLTDRRTGAHESVLGTYVLGCDGANSVVRAAIGARMDDLRFEQRWLVVDVATGADLGQWEGVHQVCDAARAATYMRIGERRHRWEFRLLPGETAADYATLEALLPLLRPWVSDVPPADLELVRCAEYTFRAQLADRWRDRHVFLLGDAAHLTPPFIGQGLCAGLRDAMNLSWKLAGVLDGRLPERVLETYEAERRPHARALIRLAKLMGVLMTQGGRVGDLARHLVVPRLRHLPGLRAKVLDSETPPLCRTALVQRPRLRRSLVGRLCPNAVLADGRRLDDAVGNQFAVVCATEVSPSQRDALNRRGTVLVEATPSTPLHRWLTEQGSTAALVRPDRTVMIAGRDAESICAAAPGFALASAG
ncbi:bifunctional 3-(3-hydroxy-phenyl)propionate/3-hydroxycinnamic acid hydroxylase [Nocardioides pocheonensis]|uniref:Bifunctional 3-(3-hydroxy-phenyl)propionate/3-hydroxycinnamic acid hydroxylase n=1 Tax=Nocardioides pocheonensis TaxID=661485 RepID=A0A3N0GGW4_9ACTN|nr:bifunctional 3-(3-hydroxy-phenyl)propionate/3-hydroxycinnamic acid hydroxylase [Nocardioides pocheonensis]RNM11669.1 bifunctional 3-(3-hydroxy-phenyl)propionate/3-hydroxycinnamic acid hydroxylase [Nocardioides pocheonensis]